MTTKTKYGLVGLGRLGSEVETVLTENNFEAVLKVDINGSSVNGIPEVIIDCSLPEVFPKTMELVNDYKVPLVMAATGLSDIQLNQLKKLSETVPVVQSYNYSIGVQVLLKLTELANQMLPDWDVEISETHHRFKKDKPSGTAKMIHRLFNDKDPQMSSLRLGNVAGDHTVYFGGLGEVLSITHSATSRRTFAEGILKAVQFIISKKNGMYTFTDVMFNSARED